MLMDLAVFLTVGGSVENGMTMILIHGKCVASVEEEGVRVI